MLRLQKLKRLQEATGVDVGSTTTAATASVTAAASSSGDGESNSSSSGVNVGDMKAVATVGGKMSSIQQEIDNCREPLIGTVTPPPSPGPPVLPSTLVFFARVDQFFRLPVRCCVIFYNNQCCMYVLV